MIQIKILHLSDLHFGIQKTHDYGYLYRRPEIIKNFFDDFNEQITAKGWNPDIIVISGDLGWFGQKDEYIKSPDETDDTFVSFQHFLEKLLSVSDVSIDKVICCPGNHDKQIPKSVKSNLFRTVKTLDQSAIKSITPFYSDYSHSMREIGIQPFENDYSQDTAFGGAGVEYLFGYRLIDRVCFIVLNSTWLCDYRKKTDKGYLLGNRLFYDVSMWYRTKHPGADPFSHIVIYHHPDDWFNSDERMRKSEHDRSLYDDIRLFSNTGPIILNGHIHNSEDTSDRHSLRRTSGTLSSNDVHQYISSQCWLYDISFNEQYPRASSVKLGKYYSYLDEKTSVYHWRFDTMGQQFFSSDYASNQMIEQIIVLCNEDPCLANYVVDEYGEVEALFQLDLSSLFNLYFRIFADPVFRDAIKQSTKRLIKVKTPIYGDEKL